MLCVPPTGYSKLQATKPQTIGFALNDSPVGEALAQRTVFCFGDDSWCCSHQGSLCMLLFNKQNDAVLKVVLPAALVPTHCLILNSCTGLLAYIVEKFRTWSDCHGDVESRFTKDEVGELPG